MQPRCGICCTTPSYAFNLTLEILSDATRRRESVASPYPSFNLTLEILSDATQDRLVNGTANLPFNLTLEILSDATHNAPNYGDGRQLSFNLTLEILSDATAHHRKPRGRLARKEIPASLGDGVGESVYTLTEDVLFSQKQHCAVTAENSDGNLAVLNLPGRKSLKLHNTKTADNKRFRFRSKK